MFSSNISDSPIVILINNLWTITSVLFFWIVKVLLILIGGFIIIYTIITGLICVFSFNKNPFKFMENVFNNLILFNSQLLWLAIEIMKIIIEGGKLTAQSVNALNPL